jgi:hypothetical protein
MDEGTAVTADGFGRYKHHGTKLELPCDIVATDAMYTHVSLASRKKVFVTELIYMYLIL